MVAVLLPEKNLNMDRQGFFWKAALDLPAEYTNEQVAQEAKRLAEWLILDSYKHKGWVHYREAGDPPFWVRGGKYAPLENGQAEGRNRGKSVETRNTYKMDNQSIGVRWGDVLPDLSQRRWFVVLRFHGKPTPYMRLVHDPNEPIKQSIVSAEDGVW